MEDLLTHIRREIQASERRLRACLLTAVGAATLILLGAMLALTSVLLGVGAD